MKFLICGKLNVGHPAIPIKIGDIGLAKVVGFVERTHQHRVSGLTSPVSGSGRIDTVHPQFDTRAPVLPTVNVAGK